MRLLVGMFLSLFCVVDMETSNGLMIAAGELMMLNRLLIVPGVEHAMLNIRVNMCFLMLMSRGSMVLQRSGIMSSPGILWSSLPVHIRGRLYLLRETFYSYSQGAWRLFDGDSWALSLTASSVMRSLSLPCLVSLSLGAILFLPNFCPPASASRFWHVWGCWSFWSFYSISIEGCGYYCSKTKHNFS